MTFHGTLAAIQVGNHLHTVDPFYDPLGQPLGLRYRPHLLQVEIPRPPALDRMRRIASALAAGFDFVRVDLYALPERVVFGELTFTPTAGTLCLSPERWDAELGTLC